MKYKRIEIKTEADLPKEEDWYFIFFKKTIDTSFNEKSVWQFNPSVDGCVIEWMSYVFAYLIPKKTHHRNIYKDIRTEHDRDIACLKCGEMRSL